MMSSTSTRKNSIILDPGAKPQLRGRPSLGPKEPLGKVPSPVEQYEQTAKERIVDLKELKAAVTAATKAHAAAEKAANKANAAADKATGAVTKATEALEAAKGKVTEAKDAEKAAKAEAKDANKALNDAAKAVTAAQKALDKASA